MKKEDKGKKKQELKELMTRNQMDEPEDEIQTEDGNAEDSDDESEEEDSDYVPSGLSALTFLHGGGSDKDDEEESAEDSAEDGADESAEDSAGKGKKKPEKNKQMLRGRGLYRYIKISVPTLNKIIIVLCIILVIVLIIGISNRGYTVTFDSMGGTSVESATYMYGDLIEEPDPPTREGYKFTGWYKYEDLGSVWDMDTDEVQEPMTLYAGWEEE